MFFQALNDNRACDMSNTNIWWKDVSDNRTPFHLLSRVVLLRCKVICDAREGAAVRIGSIISMTPTLWVHCFDLLSIIR